MLNHLRKPSFSILLSFIILFASCNSNQDLSFQESITTDEYIDTHVKLTMDLIEILQNENNIDFSRLETTEKVNSFEELKIVLQEANIQDYENLIGVVQNINKNNDNFLTIHSPYSPAEINNMVEMKLKNDDFGLFSKDPTCESQREDAGDACAIAAAVSFTASTVSAFFTLGVGTVIGYTTTALATAASIGRANLQYDCCRGARSSGC